MKTLDAPAEQRRKTAIMKVSTLVAVCDGDTIRRAEPEVLQGPENVCTVFVQGFCRQKNMVVR